MIFRRKKESLISKIFSHKIFISLIGLAIIILISIPLAKNVSKRYVINQEIRKLQEEIQEMEKKNNELRKLAEYLESDQFIAEQARLNLNYKKEGEEMVVIKDKGSDAKKNETVNTDSPFEIKGGHEEVKKPASNPRQWWDYFFNKQKV